MISGGRDVIVGMFIAVGLATAGCAPSVADGAQRIYSTSQICPAEGVTVRLRSDLPPHSVLKGVTPPPGVALDSVGDTYEITGCNKKMLMVCGHPIVGTHPDPFSAAATSDDDGIRVSLNTGTFTITRALSIEDDRVSTVVVCQPASQAAQ
jgi:hypothetical protein